MTLFSSPEAMPQKPRLEKWRRMKKTASATAAEPSTASPKSACQPRTHHKSASDDTFRFNDKGFNDKRFKQRPPLAVYIHWPFCRTKCPYCDFNSHVAADIDAQRWCRAFLQELDYLAFLVPERRLVSLFFGGGTPSLMPPDIPAALIARAKDHWLSDHDLEITLEANPTSSEAALFSAYAEAGVNRLSLGVQTLDTIGLRFLGRDHDHFQALDALAIARSIFPRVSVDLIYARPQQTLASWMNEIDTILPHLGDHISLYQLTIEKGTPFYARHQDGDITLPDTAQAADLYTSTQQKLAAANYQEYEISNYARPGAACRHNLTYWRYGEYGGIGPGAHGRLTIGSTCRTATATIAAPQAWLSRVERRGHGLAHRGPLSLQKIRDEYLMMGLRMREGVNLDAYKTLTGRDLFEGRAVQTLEPLLKSGDLSLRDSHLIATPQGRLRLNAVLACLLA